jgi:putative PIN family toxin of toxin-antitoxin system
MRVVIDTNVLVSGIAYPDSIPGKILQLWRNGRLDMVLSRYILDEFKRVLPRLRQNSLGKSEIEQLATTFLFTADVIDAVDIPQKVRDPDDDPVLATLEQSQADYLMTGDKDLLALVPEYPVVTPANFWQQFGA